jgi:two-component system cell cycle response regulator
MIMKCESVSAREIRKATILIAGASRTQAAVMKDFLEMNGYEAVVAGNGTSLFDAIEQHDPDVILLNRKLPDLDGAKICRRLKQDPNTSGIPIIMLADKESTTDKVAGLAAGADDYIALPYNDEELGALICARLRAKSEWDDLKQKTRHLEAMLSRVESLANIDPLTGLFNRRRFESVMASELKRAFRYELPLSCLILDIDHFKKENDTYGHQSGDEVLRETARTIQNTIREVDLAARWGGDEFIILNPNTGKNNAVIVGEKILKAVSSLSHACLGNRNITVSIGVSGIPHADIGTMEQLVHNADLAMYEAKKNGRNRVVTAP